MAIQPAAGELLLPLEVVAACVVCACASCPWRPGVVRPQQVLVCMGSRWRFAWIDKAGRRLGVFAQCQSLVHVAGMRHVQFVMGWLGWLEVAAGALWRTLLEKAAQRGAAATA